MTGQRRDSGSYQDCVQPAAHSISAAVGLIPVGGLEAEAVLDADEVEQAALCLSHQVGPVRGSQQLSRAAVWLAPRCLVPARAIQRCRQVHALRSGNRHLLALPLFLPVPIPSDN